ncbi:hypothetical protein LCGC14_2860400 [marine sediment metagenome]|uniref:Uncharacterized protein n=1 Tax=marine sediment metagenome TaxID=412755 RepID=A0A0F9AE50_9ZZZZ
MSELIEYLEERRDTFKVLAEGAKVLFPIISKALREKMDRDMLELLEREGNKEE